MKWIAVVTIALMCVAACGGGGGGGSSTGTVSMAITDAKPALPPDVQHVYVTIDEVSVHQSGGAWTSLDLAPAPFTIDLLQFSNGNTTQLVPPQELTAGHYTQVRLGVSSAKIVMMNGDELPLNIPSGSLKTDKNFDFQVEGGGAVALTVDFDLSQSIVATGSGTYQLKPVLHLVETAAAAKITGTIAAASFGSTGFATVLVTLDTDNSGDASSGDLEYTRLIVDKPDSGDAAFSVFWLLPGQRYIVRIWIGDAPVDPEANGAAPPIFTEVVPSPTGVTAAGGTYPLNGGLSI